MNMTLIHQLKPTFFVSYIHLQFVRIQVCIPRLFYPQFIQKTFRLLVIITFIYCLIQCKKPYYKLLNRQFIIKNTFYFQIETKKLMSEKFSPQSLDLDKYVRNFRIFYSKIIAGHPQQVNLQKKYRFLLENQVTKWRSGLFVKNVEDSATSVKSFLSKARSQQTKTDGKKPRFQWLMETSDFTRAFLFGCLVSLLEAKSKQGVQVIRQHLENDDVFVEDKIFRGAELRKIIYTWSKIQKLFQNNFNAKPHFIIGDCLNQFPNQFIDKIYRVFTQGKISMMDVGQFHEQRMKKLADMIKISITYFQMQNSQLKTIKKCGQFKKNIHIGFLLDEKMYVVSNQLPKKLRSQVQKQKTLIKLSKISQDLYKMYQSSDMKYNNLDSVILAKQRNTKGLSTLGLQTPPKIGIKTLKKSSISVNSSRF